MSTELDAARELATLLLDRFLVQKDEQGRKGTEGRDVHHLFHLPFGNNSNNQFGRPIRIGIGVFSNSYDDGALEDLRYVMNLARRILGLPEQVDDPVDSMRVVRKPKE